MKKSLETSFFKQCLEKVLLFDGAMGTCIQQFNLTEDDFEGNDGCNEFLVNTRPHIIQQIHADYFKAGSDIVETNSFGSTDIVLAEYDLQDLAYVLSKKSAEIAKTVARDFSTDKPRYVAGSVGPTTKLPSLGHISYDDLKRSYIVQMEGLVDGGADVLLIETCQDLLQVKAAIAAANAVRQKQNRYIPIMAQVTIETTGTMLVGMDIATVVNALQPYDIDVLGMNCATGPKEMASHIRHLAHNSPFFISCLPNAGIPENVGGQAHYHLTPDGLAEHLSHFVSDLGVNIIGGCCGTTPAHIAKLDEVVTKLTPGHRPETFTQSTDYCMTSLYTSVPMQQDPPPVLVGERTNANGSKKFRDLLGEENYDALVDIGRQQIKSGAHLLDVCTAYVGRDEVKDMHETITRFNQQLDVPLMIDSTELNVIESALKLIAGKAVVNSINLEDGENRPRAVLTLCKEFGSSVVALTIDEDGMAKTAEKKLAIAGRLYDMAVHDYGLDPHDLIFDPLTFTLGSGDEEFRKAGIETIEAIRLIHEKYPEVSFVLGISNISFGLKPAVRHVLNSVFLHYAMEAGLNMAIINSAHILPLHKISEEERTLCRQLIFDERTFDGDRVTFDPLISLMAYYDANDASAVQRAESKMPEAIEERLKYRIINGEKTGMDTDLAQALERYPALEIINRILLDGMKTVGELFGKGEMQLPFVLQSAEVMKTAVAYLEPHMDRVEGETSKGVMVLATVKGDVHDIGKNLVDIILTNNGYKVHNIGIKQSIETILETAKETNADAIGMSGLLVKSTAIMKENLAVMKERGWNTPVVLGGAALTPRFVAEDCQAEYNSPVYYAKDAFAGLHAMEKIMGGETMDSISADHAAPAESGYQAVGDVNRQDYGLPPDHPDFFKRSSDVDPDVPIPPPPFWGSKIVTDIPLPEIYEFMNDQALIAGQWQVKRGSRTSKEHAQFLEEKIYPTLERLKATALEEQRLAPRVIYGFYPCNSENNSLVIYEPDVYEKSGDKIPWQRFDFPRGGVRNLCLADYFAPIQNTNGDSSKTDVVAVQLVTVGNEASEYAQTLFKSDNYSEYLYFHGFSVEMAEALAEYWHRQVRREWGIAGQDATDVKKLFAQGYQGSRFSPGYPACPRLEDQAHIFAILDPQRIGVNLSEEFMLEPEQSTSALVVHHPQARYFDVRQSADKSGVSAIL